MARSHLDREIERLKKKLLSLGALVETSVRNGVQSFLDRDVLLAERVKAGDKEIDDLEVEVEEDCLKLLALYQPVATDLRYIIAALKINNDFERMADLAANIASRAINLSKEPVVESPIDISEMSSRVHSMVKDSLQSLIQLDTGIALKILNDDGGIDKMYKETYQAIQSRINKDPSEMKQMILYLSASRHLERIADLATNIAEDVIYLIDGQIIRHQRIENI